MNFRHLSYCCSVHINHKFLLVGGQAFQSHNNLQQYLSSWGKFSLLLSSTCNFLSQPCNSLKEHIRIMLVTSPPKDHHNPSLEAGCPLRPRSQTYSSYSSCHSSPSRTTCAGCLLPIHSRPVFCSECFKVQYPNLQRFPNNNVVFLISVRYCSVRCKLTSFSSHKGDCKKKNL